MENKLKEKVIVDRNGSFRCLSCWSVISKQSVIRILKCTLEEQEGKKVYAAFLRIQKYLLEV